MTVRILGRGSVQRIFNDGKKIGTRECTKDI